MSSESTALWTVSVSKETDIAVQDFLFRHGVNRDDLSKFIEDAVKWLVFDQSMAEARANFADLSSEALDSLLDQAVTATHQIDAFKAS